MHRRHIFLPRALRLNTPFKILWTNVKGPDLNIGVVCGKLILGIRSVVLEVDQRNQTIRKLKTALRELLGRQTREDAIASEVVKRAEELAKKQQAVLDEAER
ncbi:hypothetical protein PIB30_051961 [Stylosanthes scabra]|uniref:Uncharacterized protein n=1 Tax=Stylosanthes scabra TaxID=79078 RepID=A0ABU6YGU0_9FABA|nr:hypothetical protein [Stylosanthes scabra]